MRQKRSWSNWLTRWIVKLRYFWDSIRSKEYWRYAVWSLSAGATYLSVFGAFYLVVEALDFFKIVTREEYSAYAFLIFCLISAVIVLIIRRPVGSVKIKWSKRDTGIELKIGDIFDMPGAIMISTNTEFESDVSGGRIALDSLQGQFTDKYFAGRQNELTEQIETYLEGLDETAPYSMGTTVPVATHSKTFYLTVMSKLNERGNASTTPKNVRKALAGLWKHVRKAGELEELAVPVVGTGRGRLGPSRKKVIALIAESFVEASKDRKITDKLTIVIRSEDASQFEINLREVKNYLSHVLE